MQPTPFLDVGERVQYLHDRGYFNKSAVTDSDRARLANINFHYFLGYARNYRALVGRKEIAVTEAQKRPEDVFKLIELDAEVSAVVHSALRSAEWRLRSLTVQHYCTKYEPHGTFLGVTQYRETGPGERERLIASVLTHIYRHDEPYVSETLPQAVTAAGTPCPRRYEHTTYSTCHSLAAALPLWAVIDSFSLGLLGHPFLMVMELIAHPIPLSEPHPIISQNQGGFPLRVPKTPLR